MFEEDGKRQALQGRGDRWKEDVRVPHAKASVFEHEADHRQGAWWSTLSEVKNVQ